MSVQELKAQLRRDLRSRLTAVNVDWHEPLRLQLKNWLSYQSGIWGAFWPLPGEPDLRPLWKELDQLTWVFPRIDGDELAFHAPGEDWVEGLHGIREPSIHSPIVEASRIRGLLIPGLGFDRRGRRLGRGKGFYDRLLSGWTGLKVGVCFECQWVDSIPTEAHDQKMDLIVTEAGLWMPS